MVHGAAARCDRWVNGADAKGWGGRDIATPEYRDTGPMSFWEEPEQVQRFAEKEPDHRLVELLESFSDPGHTRVLDLGCASGRNTVLLAQLGFDFYAVDSSVPMVERTRERVAEVSGESAAIDRVAVGWMEDLSQFEDGFFNLIVSLGIYHQARSPGQWRRALDETHRVLAADGLLLAATFSPESQPQGEPLSPVPGQDHMYEGFSSGPLCLIDQDDWDEMMAAYGLVAEIPTQTAQVPTEDGYRVTVNLLYRKRAS
ncbi:MAG: class I SAM-dependent methyltransferase [Gemmatimonadota bacterium]|nr:MAG: class I SAM-dependent methyltransferase [Gemmatimonadota bacterium]